VRPDVQVSNSPPVLLWKRIRNPHKAEPFFFEGKFKTSGDDDVKSLEWVSAKSIFTRWNSNNQEKFSTHLSFHLTSQAQNNEYELRLVPK
jgi:hypothetical protein